MGGGSTGGERVPLVGGQIKEHVDYRLVVA